MHGFDRAATDFAQEPVTFAAWVIPWTQYFPNAVFTDLPVFVPLVDHYAATFTISSQARGSRAGIFEMRPAGAALYEVAEEQHRLEARPRRPGSTPDCTIMSIMSYVGKCGLADAIVLFGAEKQRQLGQTACPEFDSLGSTMMHRAMMGGKCGLLALSIAECRGNSTSLRTGRVSRLGVPRHHHNDLIADRGQAGMSACVGTMRVLSRREA